MKQAVKNIPKRKIAAVKELSDLIKSKKTILIADISGIPGSQFQSITKKLRGKAIVKVPKRNLLYRAINLSGKKEILNLKEKIKGAIAVLFSDLDAYDLGYELIKNKSPAKAKAGQIASKEIEIPAGPTELVPGPAISELGALGIQIMIQGGKIEIKEPRIVAKLGEEIKPNVAAMLSKLNILPFEIGFSPKCAYDAESNSIYLEISIDEESAKENLVSAYSKALPFAINIGYISEDTVPFMIQKAGSYEKRLIKVINGEPEEEIKEEVQEEAVPAQKETKQEEKEEPKVDFAASFF